MKETSVSDEMIVCTFPTRNVTENEIILRDFIIGGSNIAFMKQKRTQKKTTTKIQM